MSFYSFDDFFEEDLILLTKKDKNYDNFRKSFNKRIDKYPQYIALCKTEKGVQRAIALAN